MDKIKLEKISSAQFIYELHEMDNSNLNFKDAIGYCDSKDVSVLPKVNRVCVMFWTKDKDYFWCHVPYSMFNHNVDVDKDFIEEDQTLEEFEQEFERTVFEHQREQIKNDFLDEIDGRSAFSRNLDSVSIQSNGNGRMYFVRVANEDPSDKGDPNSWWAYNINEAEMNPEKVRVVNCVGGYHHKDFTTLPRIYDREESNRQNQNIWKDSEYEFIQAGNREQAERLFSELQAKGIKLDYLGNKI